METRNPIEGYFDSEFPAIYNHFGVIGAQKSQDIKIFWEICAFIFEKNNPLW